MLLLHVNLVANEHITRTLNTKYLVHHSNFQTFGVFCQLIIQPLAILFGGHLGTIALGTLGLANSVCDLTQVLPHINNPNVSDHLCAL